MKKLLILFFLALILLLSFFYFRVTDEKIIKKRIYRACALLSKDAAENPAAGALKIFEFSGLCSDTINIEISALPFFSETMSNEVLISEITRYRAISDSISINPVDLAVYIDEENQDLASVELVVKANAGRSEFFVDEIFFLKIKMHKKDKKWLFFNVSENVLKK